MKSGRVTLSAIGLATLIALFFFLPLPVGRVRQIALVQVQPNHVEKMFLYAPGILEQLYVRDGQQVHKDQVLAIFRNLDLDSKLIDAKTQYDIADNQADSFQRVALDQGSVADPDEQMRLQMRYSSALGERMKAASQVAFLSGEIAHLEFRAPRDGIVMSPPKTDEIGKEYERGDTLFSVGDPGYLRVLMPVSPDELRLLSHDLDQVNELSVDIRVRGHGERIWHSKLLKRSQLPEDAAKEIPVQLTNKGGGNVAVKPSTKPNSYSPQSQQYLVGIDILDPDDSIRPGTMAQVKVHLRWRSCAWFCWRWFNSAFDLGWGDFIR